MFFQALDSTYAQSNAVHVRQGDEFILDLVIIIVTYDHYFKELIGPQLIMSNEAIRAHQEFMMWWIVYDHLNNELDACLTEHEVKMVLRHLPSGKRPA